MKRTLAACAAVLAFTACGTGGTQVASTPTPNPANDRATGRLIVFGPLDFPAGWKHTAHRVTPDDAELDKKLATCLGVAPQDVAEVATVYGNDFSRGAMQVGSSVEFVRTVDQAKGDFAALKTPKVSTCFRKFLGPELQREIGKEVAGARVGAVTVTALKVPRLGEGSLGYRITATITAAGRTFKVFVDSILIQKERAEISASFTALNGPFDGRLRGALLTRLGNRLGIV